MNPNPTGHPRHVATLEDEIAETKSAKIDELQTFHDEFYGTQAGQVSIVGDFDETEITKLTNDLLGNWKSKKAFARIPEKYFRTDGERKVFEVPDKANALYRLGLNLDMRDQPQRTLEEADQLRRSRLADGNLWLELLGESFPICGGMAEFWSTRARAACGRSFGQTAPASTRSPDARAPRRHRRFEPEGSR